MKLATAGGHLRHMGLLISTIVLVFMIIFLAYGVLTANISALPEPGPFETAIAGKAKAWYISRASRGALPPMPASDAASVSDGSSLFDMGCASCHGKDGRTPTNIGKAMYPRVLNLGAPEVQKMSNRELFWVIKNGIRLSGMPGFAKILSDQETWQVTYFVRGLNKQSHR